jgi:hypothetical protein
MKLCVLMLSSVLLARSFAADFLPEERTAVFPREQALAFIHAVCRQVPEGITSFWSPKVSDLDGLEESLPVFLQSARPELAKWLFGDRQPSAAKWSWLRRQAVGVRKGGRDYLLIAYHCEDPAETAQKEKEARAKMGERYQPDQWKARPLTANGGGSSFFRALFDVQKREFVWYEENEPE